MDEQANAEEITASMRSKVLWFVITFVVVGPAVFAALYYSHRSKPAPIRTIAVKTPAAEKKQPEVLKPVIPPAAKPPAPATSDAPPQKALDPRDDKFQKNSNLMKQALRITKEHELYVMFQNDLKNPQKTAAEIIEAAKQKDLPQDKRGELRGRLNRLFDTLADPNSAQLAAKMRADEISAYRKAKEALDESKMNADVKEEVDKAEKFIEAEAKLFNPTEKNW